MAIEYGKTPLIIGKHHIHLKRVNSTNAYASDLVSKSKPIEGSVISASFQFNGKGQIGRSWQSEANKNILCSIVLHPNFLNVIDQMVMNMSVALALHDFISSIVDDPVFIKWPNDIYIKNKKVAGILIQNTIRGKKLDTSIVGTGININQKDFPEEIPNPTSVSLSIGKNVNLDDAYLYWFYFLEKRYEALKFIDFYKVLQEYNSKLYLKDDISSFVKIENKKNFLGTIKGADLKGRLHILTEHKELLKFNFREIKYDL